MAAHTVAETREQETADDTAVITTVVVRVCPSVL